MKSLIFTLLMCAATQSYSLEFKKYIVARSNYTDSLNFPSMSFIHNQTPKINNNGDIAISVLAYDEESNPTHNIWIRPYSKHRGDFVYTSPVGMFLSPVEFNERGKLAFIQSDSMVNDGVFVTDFVNGQTSNELKSTKDLGQLKSAHIDNAGNILARFQDGKGNHGIVVNREGESDVAFVGSILEGKHPVSYVFTPSQNDFGSFAVKTRLGNKREWSENRPDVITYFEEGKSEIVAFDSDYDKSSEIRSFFNSLSINDLGDIAFVAKIKNQKTALFVYLRKERELRKVIDTTKNKFISELEHFSPVINNQRQIAFRAFDSEKKRGVFLLSNFSEIHKVVGASDSVWTDYGMAIVKDVKGGPSISAGIDLNDNGEIVFNILLEREIDNVSLGQAIYLAQPVK